MFTQRQTHLEKVFLSAVASLLLLTPEGQSAILTDNLQTTATPALSNSTLTTQLNNSSIEELLIMRSHRPCGSTDENFCGNGGKCIYPQDNDEPSCICPPSYTGQRCMFFTEHTHSLPELEQMIAISFGIFMLIAVLAIIIYCIAYKKCIKSAPIIKSAPSKSPV
ncbi:epigen-like [Dicentrarchus labrax]|uniref:epigen-like n=1 Tax=Dicentrarchus labrax TaxID=13489 RepID=UPI001633DD85|nr:epigen-like [Dicentrarchus labrax]